MIQIEEVSFWKTTSLWSWSLIVSASLLLSKFAWGLLKEKNTDLENLKEEVAHIKKCLIVNCYDKKGGKVEEVALSDYVQRINHKLDNMDAGEAGALQVILDSLEELKRKENGMAFEILKKLDK